MEVRVPLLDHELVEWMAGLAPGLKLKNREGKYIFKKSLEPYLPNDILYRPKMGFAVPLAGWFKGPLKEQVEKSLLGEVMRDSGLFDQQFLTKMVDQNKSGIVDHSTSIWSLLMFESFLKSD